MRIYSTKRLQLVAATLEHINAEIKEPGKLALLLNVKVGEGWPPGEYDISAQEYFRELLEKGGKEYIGWLGWYAVTKSSEEAPSVLVAAGGFFGPPLEAGVVEIGYSVVSSYRNKGYATEIVKALVEIAQADKRVKRIVARTVKNNLASIRVLEKAGFRLKEVGEENEQFLFEIHLNNIHEEEGSNNV